MLCFIEGECCESNSWSLLGRKLYFGMFKTNIRIFIYWIKWRARVYGVLPYASTDKTANTENEFHCLVCEYSAQYEKPEGFAHESDIWSLNVAICKSTVFINHRVAFFSSTMPPSRSFDCEDFRRWRGLSANPHIFSSLIITARGAARSRPDDSRCSRVRHQICVSFASPRSLAMTLGSLMMNAIVVV